MELFNNFISSSYLFITETLSKKFPESEAVKAVRSRLLNNDKLEVTIENNIQLADIKSHLIISNHISCLDYSAIRKLINCKVVTYFSDSSKTYDENVEDGIITYKIGSGEIVKRKIIEEIVNHNILLFPEGKINLTNKPLKFYRGGIETAYLNGISILTIKLQFIDDDGNDITNEHNSNIDIIFFLGDFPIKNPHIRIRTLEIVNPKDYTTFNDFYDKVYSCYLS